MLLKINYVCARNVMVLVSLKNLKNKKTLWQGWEQLEILFPLTQLTVKGVFHLYKVKASKHPLKIITKLAFHLSPPLYLIDYLKLLFSVSSKQWNRFLHQRYKKIFMHQLNALGILSWFLFFLEAEKGRTSSSKIHVFAEILQKHCQKLHPHTCVCIIGYFSSIFHTFFPTL